MCLCEGLVSYSLVSIHWGKGCKAFWFKLFWLKPSQGEGGRVCPPLSGPDGALVPSNNSSLHDTRRIGVSAYSQWDTMAISASAKRAREKELVEQKGP